MLEFKLPEIGENITTATITNILVAVGDSVEIGQDLVEIETEKASLPIPSPVNGTIKEILISVNDEIQIGSVMFKIDGKAPSEKNVNIQEQSQSMPVQTEDPKTPTTPPPAPQPAVAEASEKNTGQNIIVIGGGPGGYAAAFRAADLGQKVTLIDLDVNPGGVCLYRVHSL